MAIYFGVHTLFPSSRAVSWVRCAWASPAADTLRLVPFVIAVAAAVMVFSLRWPVLRTVGACATVGLAAGLVALPTT